jgi:hypothetical protein
MNSNVTQQIEEFVKQKTLIENEVKSRCASINELESKIEDLKRRDSFDAWCNWVGQKHRNPDFASWLRDNIKMSFLISEKEVGDMRPHFSEKNLREPQLLVGLYYEQDDPFVTLTTRLREIGSNFYYSLETKEFSKTGIKSFPIDERVLEEYVLVLFMEFPRLLVAKSRKNPNDKCYSDQPYKKRATLLDLSYASMVENFYKLSNLEEFVLADDWLDDELFVEDSTPLMRYCYYRGAFLNSDLDHILRYPSKMTPKDVSPLRKKARLGVH